jgi:predicted permease
VGLGFQTDSILEVSLDWSRSGDAHARIGPLSRAVLDRLGTIAGIRSATLAAMTPISGAAGSQFISVPGFAENPDVRRRVSLNVVAPRYFETLGTPFVAGRDFSAGDQSRSRVAIVNQAMARHYFGTSSPLDRQFTIEGERRALQIVGVVGDAKYQDLHEAPPPTIYLNALQGSGSTNLIFVLRTRVPPMAVVSTVRAAFRDMLPDVPVETIRTLADQVDASILPERLIAMLSELFGALAAALAAIGLYGLLAYTVTRRTKEIGLRRAIGATDAHVVRMIVTSALGLVALGSVVGAPIALWARSYAATVLMTVAGAEAASPTMLPVSAVVPVTIALLAMVAVALAASYVPARRATNVDPMVALRCE